MLLPLWAGCVSTQGVGDLCHATGMLTSSRLKQHHLKSSSYSELNFSCVHHEVPIKMLKTVFVVLRSLQDSLLLWHFSLLSSVDNKIVFKVMVPALQNEKYFLLKRRGGKKGGKKRWNKTKPERRWGGGRGKWGKRNVPGSNIKKAETFDVYFSRLLGWIIGHSIVFSEHLLQTLFSSVIHISRARLTKGRGASPFAPAVPQISDKLYHIVKKNCQKGTFPYLLHWHCFP